MDISSPRKARPDIARSLSAQPYLSAPSRASTAPAHPHHGSKKHHLDFLHHHSKRQEDKDKDKSSTLPSTLGHFKPTAAIDKIVHRSSGNKSGATSQNISRPGSTILSDNGLVPVRSRFVRPGEVERERERAKEREQELQTSLNELSELAHSSTRRLDDTYYSLLEKIEVLRSTIRSMQELTEASTKLYNDFQTDVGDLQKDIDRQVSAFGGFQDQQNRIEDLESRVKKGQGKAQTLSERLEAARKRVELWEKRENEWQANMSKRLRVGWVTTTIVLLLVLLLVIWRHLSRLKFERHLDIGALRKLLENTSLPAFAANDIRQIISSRLTTSGDLSKSTAVAVPSDGRLKRFDEL